MDGHVRQAHSENFQCGLCEFKASHAENLETHLFTCEICECNYCAFKKSRLADLTDHLKSEHNFEEGDTVYDIVHMKMYRNSYKAVSSKLYCLEEFLGTSK